MTSLTVSRQPERSVSVERPAPRTLTVTRGAARGYTGKSAYEIWLDEGNTGSVQDFLDSLRSNAPGVFAYVHDQGVLATVWHINHNLGFIPAGVFVVDSGGTQWEGEVRIIDNDNLDVTFLTAVSGFAYVS